jgi:RND superfamily putative drug exporter
MLGKLGRECASHPVIVLASWVVALALAWGIGLGLGGSGNNNFTLPNSQSQVALDQLASGFPQEAGTQATLVFEVPDGDKVSSSDFESQIKSTLSAIKKLDDVASVSNPFDSSASTVSKSGQVASANVQYSKSVSNLEDNSQVAFSKLQNTTKGFATDGLTIELGGTMPGAQPLAINPLRVFFSLLAAAVLLLFALGTGWSFAWPIVSAVIGVGLGAGLLQVLEAFISVPTISSTVAVMIGLGVGIDYGLFVTARVKEEHERGEGKISAVELAIDSAGRAAVTAGATVIVALIALLIFQVPAINAMAVSIAITAACVVLASVTLLPGILGWVGNRTTKGAVPFLHHKTDEDGAGTAWTGKVIKFRWPAFVAGVAALIVLALPALTGSLTLGPLDNSLFPPDSTQYKAQEVQTEQYGPGYPNPFLLVAQIPLGDQNAQADLTSIVKDVQGTSGVVVVTRPTANSDGTLAVFDVVPSTSAQDLETPKLVSTLRDTVLPKAVKGTNIKVLVSGNAAVFVDLDNVITDRLLFFIGTVILIAFLILTAVFRSLLVPLTAAFFNVLTIFATYGVIVAVFTWGWGLSFLGVPDTVPIISILAPVIFAVIFGLSNDYEVYMVSRMKEEYKLGRSAREAVRVGHGRSIRIVLTAALIMVFVFASYAFQPGTTIKQFGFGMAVAIIIDAFITRMVLLPAVTAIGGRAMWWFPGQKKADQADAAVSA